MDHNSVDSIQLLRLDLEVEADCIHKKDYPQNDTKNQENVLKMADTKQVRRLITTPRIITQTVQNTRAVQPGEQPQRTIQAQKILQANRETGAVQSFVLPKNTTIRTVPGQNVQGKIVPHPNDPSKRILIHPMLPPKNPGKSIKYCILKENRQNMT